MRHLTRNQVPRKLGLYNKRARWYDPEVGRFLGEDPTGFADGPNSYLYAGNDPVNFYDPTGLCNEFSPLSNVYDSIYTPINTGLTTEQVLGLNSYSSSYNNPLDLDLSISSIVNAPASDMTLISQSYASMANPWDSWIDSEYAYGLPIASKGITTSLATTRTAGLHSTQLSLRNRLVAELDQTANPKTGYSLIDVPITFVNTIGDNLIAKPLIMLGTNWREDTMEDRINTIYQREQAIPNQPGGGFAHLVANATTDNMVFPAAGYDPVQNREQTILSLEGGARFASGVSSTASMAAGPLYLAGKAPTGTLNPTISLGRTRISTSPSRIPSQLVAGQAAETSWLTDIGAPKSTTVWRPTIAQTESAGFQVVVGKPRFTSGGKPVGTIIDVTQGGSLVELKSGYSTLNSTYQLRLQTYRHLIDDVPYSIQTPRPINTTFQNYLQRWGVKVQPPQ